MRYKPKKLTDDQIMDRAIKLAVVAMVLSLIVVFLCLAFDSMIPIVIGTVLFYIWVVFFT